MTGNDIVDLNQARKESNWQRKGYLEKLFTHSERFLIHTAENPEMMVWLFWSMKEAAYKIGSKETTIRSFAPAAISCSNLVLHQKTASGNVTFEGKNYFTESSILESYIHTLAVTEQTLLREVSIRISPYNVADTAYKSSKPVCVSHHGNYLALIYL